MLQCLARHRLGNPTVVAHLVSAVMRQISDIRLRYLCGITGALGDLQMVPDTMLVEFDAHAKFEVQTVAIQELLENLQAFPQLEYSWQPYEHLCLEQFKERIADMKTAREVGQLADPFGAMLFLRAQGLLEPSFLEALSQWCLSAVHRPNTRSERRPTSRQLMQLHDRCREHGLESDPALQDAIGYYVESGGGQWANSLPKPLRWGRRRRYIREDDPAEDLVEPSLVASSDIFGSTVAPSKAIRRARVEDLPGLPSSDGWASQAAVDLSEETNELQEADASSSPRSQYKRCGGKYVGAFITSRKSVRPRHRRDPGLHRTLRTNWPRAPLWLNPGFCSRPKYRMGVVTPRNRFAEVPVGPRGGSWVLRR